MTNKKDLLNAINTLTVKLSEDELEHLFVYIKDILKLPRTTKLLSNEISLYLQPQITLIDKDDDDSKFKDKLINELNLNYKRKIKDYFNDNSKIIQQLLNLTDNKLHITNENSDGTVALKHSGKIDGNYYIINLNKYELNNLETNYYEKQYKHINELVSTFEKDNNPDTYEELYNTFMPFLEDNNLKIPKELKKLESRTSKILDAVQKIKEYKQDSFDIRFRRIELYSIKDILENNEDTIITFEADNFIYNINFVLKKIS
jgi:hypothetical protein